MGLLEHRRVPESELDLPELDKILLRRRDRTNDPAWFLDQAGVVDVEVVIGVARHIGTEAGIPKDLAVDAILQLQRPGQEGALGHGEDGLLVEQDQGQSGPEPVEGEDRKQSRRVVCVVEEGEDV